MIKGIERKYMNFTPLLTLRKQISVLICTVILSPVRRGAMMCSILCISLLLPSLSTIALHLDGNQCWADKTRDSKSKSKSKKRKRKKRKGYDRKRRKIEKLIEEGHPTVNLAIYTEPRVYARVYHGKEFLGDTPLKLVWAKDTGPLDVVLKAKGYLQINTRLYTYRNDKITVKMRKLEEANQLFGYKKKVKPKAEEGEQDSSSE